GTVQDSPLTNEASPVGLLQAIPCAIVIVLAMRKQHIIVSLTWGIVGAIVIGLLTGGLAPGDIFSLPPDRDTSTGLIQDGIAGVTGVVMLVLLIMARAQVVAGTGRMAASVARL